MRPEYKKGSTRVICLVAVVVIVLMTGCGSGDNPLSVDPAPFLEIVATVPMEGASDVPVEALISVTFSTEPDTSSVHDSTLRIGARAGEICCLGRTITLKLSTSLDYAQIYLVEIDSGLTGCNGAAIGSGHFWQFRTVDDPRLPDFPDPPGKLPSRSAAEP